MEKPLLAITLGDPAGIGPEVIVKALAQAAVYATCRPLVIGDQRILARAAAWCDLPPITLELISDPAAGRYQPDTITLLDLANADPATIAPGQVSAVAGRAAVEAVLRACELALAGSVDAIVTAPLNKEAMNLAGYHYAGHTELLAERTGASKVSMLLTGPKLRVVHVSTHVSLPEAIQRVTQKRVEAGKANAVEVTRTLKTKRVLTLVWTRGSSRYVVVDESKIR